MQDNSVHSRQLHAAYSNIANISTCNCGAIKHDAREYSTPYVVISQIKSNNLI